MHVIACCGYLYKQGNLNININLNLTVHIDFDIESSQRIFTFNIQIAHSIPTWQTKTRSTCWSCSRSSRAQRLKRPEPRLSILTKRL